MTMGLPSLHTLEISTSSAKRVPPEWTSTGDKRWKGAHKLRHVLLSGAEICSLSFTVKVFPKATLNKPSKISAQTWMTQFFGLLCLSCGPFGQFAGR